MCIIAQLTIAKIWNESRCLSMDKWIKKMQYTMEVYSGDRKNKILSFAGKTGGIIGHCTEQNKLHAELLVFSQMCTQGKDQKEDEEL